MYWETHDSSNPEHEKINRIILCGGDANLAGLADYLQLSMKMKVENADVWINILDTKNSIPEMSFEESLSYATVIGLSLGSYIYKSQPVINVLPDEDVSVILIVEVAGVKVPVPVTLNTVPAPVRFIVED